MKRWGAITALCLVAALSGSTVHSAPVDNEFTRGDVNLDGQVDISDGVAILEHLFLGVPNNHPCGDALDVNDSGSADLADSVYLLRHLFVSGPPPGAPYAVPGGDPTIDDDPSCGSTEVSVDVDRAAVVVDGASVKLTLRVSSAFSPAQVRRVSAAFAAIDPVSGERVAGRDLVFAGDLAQDWTHYGGASPRIEMVRSYPGGDALRLQYVAVKALDAAADRYYLHGAQSDRDFVRQAPGPLALFTYATQFVGGVPLPVPSVPNAFVWTDLALDDEAFVYGAIGMENSTPVDAFLLTLQNPGTGLTKVIRVSAPQPEGPDTYEIDEPLPPSLFDSVDGLSSPFVFGFLTVVEVRALSALGASHTVLPGLGGTGVQPEIF